MPASYEIGQEVRIRPVTQPGIRESTIVPFVGQTATISDFYWITPPAGPVFYLYTVKVMGSNKELVLYEDEITGLPGRAG